MFVAYVLWGPFLMHTDPECGALFKIIEVTLIVISRYGGRSHYHLATSETADK